MLDIKNNIYMSKKILVIGTGFLGRYLLRELNSSNIQSYGTSFNQSTQDKFKVDIRNIDSIKKCILQLKPDTIINCAANVDLDFLEKNEKQAIAINAIGAKNLALVANQNDIRLIHISTDGIFDGKKGNYSEEDVPNPINVYGKSKLMGEQKIKENSNNYVIIRTNFFGYNEQGKHLLNWILTSLKQKKQLIGFDDILFTPLEISNLCMMIRDITMKNIHGIIHLASDETISKYQFAIEVANVFELDKNLIKKGSVEDLKLIAKRPKNTSLSNKKVKKFVSVQITPLNESLIKIRNNF